MGGTRFEDKPQSDSQDANAGPRRSEAQNANMASRKSVLVNPMTGPRKSVSEKITADLASRKSVSQSANMASRKSVSQSANMASRKSVSVSQTANMASRKSVSEKITANLGSRKSVSEKITANLGSRKSVSEKITANMGSRKSVLASAVGSRKSMSQSGDGPRARSLSVRTFDFRHDKESEEEVTKEKITKCQESMRTFWKSREVTCHAAEEGLPCTVLPSKKLATGSAYDGTWEGPWMTGYGGYLFTNGAEYEGEFLDGQFHGQGDLRYPNGVKIMGVWNKGILVNRTIVFSDNLQYSEKDWLYCLDPDRRYRIEYDDGVQPGGGSYITADPPPREVPDELYDTGDGYYNPENFVYKEPEMASLLRAPSKNEKDWIESHCRTGLNGPIGPMPALYPEWLSAQLKVKPPPVPAAKVLSDTSLFKCLSVFDDEVNFMVRFLQMGGSSSSSSSSSAEEG